MSQNYTMTAEYNLPPKAERSLLNLLEDPPGTLRHKKCRVTTCRGENVVEKQTYDFNAELIVNLNRVSRNKDTGQFKLGDFRVDIPMKPFVLKRRKYFVHSIICFSKLPMVQGAAAGEYSVYQRTDMDSRWFELAGDKKLEVNQMNPNTCVSLKFWPKSKATLN